MKLKLSDKYYTLIDNEDWERISKYKWYWQTSGKKIYVIAKVNKKYIRLHRFLLNINNSKIYVDHINGDTLDNRKDNLRLCKPRFNVANQKKHQRVKPTSSKYKGVCFDKVNKKWEAYITVKRKKIKLGRFKIEIDAAIAYNEAAVKYFGEFANLNRIQDVS